MTIIGIVGSMGSGKTLIATALAHHYMKGGATVYANYKLNFDSKALRLSDIQDCDYDFHHALLIIDEIHLFLDSRTSGTKKNRIFSYFITQSRKRNLIFFYTTQNAHQVDKRLRSNTDYIIKCENMTPGAKENVIIKWTITDMNTNISKTFAIKADPFFKLYDTHQVIDFTEA